MKPITRFLGIVWSGWKKFAHGLGVVQTKVILTILYFIIIGLSSLIVRVLRKDLLDRRIHADVSHWRIRKPLIPDMEECRRQF